MESNKIKIFSILSPIIILFCFIYHKIYVMYSQHYLYSMENIIYYDESCRYILQLLMMYITCFNVFIFFMNNIDVRKLVKFNNRMTVILKIFFVLLYIILCHAVIMEYAREFTSLTISHEPNIIDLHMKKLMNLVHIIYYVDLIKILFISSMYRITIRNKIRLTLCSIIVCMLGTTSESNRIAIIIFLFVDWITELIGLMMSQFVDNRKISSFIYAKIKPIVYFIALCIHYTWFQIGSDNFYLDMTYNYIIVPTILLSSIIDSLVRSKIIRTMRNN